MKRIIITGFALLGLLRLSAQTTPTDSTGYKSTKLKVDEINLVSSYYKQDGNNSAVTGGIGSEKLTDLSNTLDVKLLKYGKTGIKHTFDIEAGIDHYTSASSDQIDLQANSSASSADNRFYPSITYSRENEEKGNTLGIGLSSSTEFDYQSFGGNVSYSKKTKDRNGEFTAKFQAYLDQVKLVLPVELRTSNGYGTESRNTFAGTLSYSQIVNQNLQIMFMADVISQSGYLSLPFHRVYFNDGTVHQENLPDTRLKIPLAVRASYFLGDNVIIRAYYRYYSDDWKLTAHTADIEVPVKLSPFFSLSPFYRYYTQSAVKYFNAYGAHTAAEEFYTSNYDLSRFNSSFMGMGLKFTPAKGVFGIKHFNTVELRYGHYTKTTQMTSDIFSINIKYK
ncbi:hypothetical protein FNO01nite_17200 [Flavobacterium noncentrifugens]|uniref:DUF3570 domain-containing protein n=1 Tax=Flavobacterium noncentrifugens TaxID=1128970 RepID=A0A1G8WU22_9FLAO|nr:DUF3570 domain-containing protein [Flavobacterium noncentrifugens]GEP51048.1 hypothetical protein FNO01nite_17200 [Flavobacterium noncentrifugens]SDJ81557.1 Protein of unknown function [Flavobacterium noncentrifugens]